MFAVTPLNEIKEDANTSITDFSSRENYNESYNEEDDNMPITVLKNGRSTEDVDYNYSPSSSRSSFDALPESRKRKASGKRDAFNWKEDAVDILIYVWRSKDILYNGNHPQYHNKDLRRIALEDIRAEMEINSIEPLPSVEDIKIKMNTLRSYFNAERNKIISSRMSGSESEAVYKTRWQHYEALMFLNDNVVPRGIHNSSRVYYNSENGEYAYPARRSMKPKKTYMDAMCVFTDSDSFPKAVTSAEEILHSSPKPPVERPVKAPVEQTAPLSTSSEFFFAYCGSIMDEIEEGYTKDMLKMDILKQIIEVKHAQRVNRSFSQLSSQLGHSAKVNAPITSTPSSSPNVGLPI